MNKEFHLLPEQASSFAAEVDRLYAFLWGVSAVMMFIIGLCILYFAIRYCRGSPADRRETATTYFWIEFTWIGVPFVIVMVMFFWGAKLFFNQQTPPADALELTGVAKQWMWKFQHPEGRAEINDLHVPLGQNVKVRLISEDVIHSMYVPAFRVKKDVLPGRYTTLWFKPTKLGRYHLFCAEYCGAKHSEMRGTVHVVEPAEYQAWLSGAEGGTSVARETLRDKFRCLSCHESRDGAAARGPPLELVFGRQVKLQDGRTVTADEDYLRESILRPQAKVVAGYPPIMPSFAGQIDETTMNQLIKELKALGRPAGPAQTSAAGEQP